MLTLFTERVQQLSKVWFRLPQALNQHIRLPALEAQQWPVGFSEDNQRWARQCPPLGPCLRYCCAEQLAVLLC